VLIEVFVAGFQSAKTRCNYRANLRAWFGWTDAGGMDGLAAERPHIEAQIRHLEQRGYAPNTICQRVASLSSFYRWAVGEGHVAANPVARRPRKPTESTASGLSRHELTDFLDAAETRGGDVYACATNVEDLGESTWHHTRTLRAPTTKGCKPAVIALAPRTVQAISLSITGRRSGPLLSITIALDAGIGLRDVQDFARHEDPKTTRRYDRARSQLNRHATYAIAPYLAGGS
jgi:integrase/recombinase XerD